MKNELQLLLRLRDARITELERALREAMEWNWLDETSPPPQEVIDQCNNALMVK